MRSEGPLHSRSVRHRTPPSAPLEHDPHHHAAEAAQYHPAAAAPQYQAAPAQYQAAHDDLHTDLADTHQTDTGEAEAPQMICLILRLLIHLIILLILRRVHHLG